MASFSKALIFITLLISITATAVPIIDKNNFSNHLQTLSSDAFEGRAPFSKGEELTLNYLVKEFKKLGLSPGNGDKYLQEVPLAKISVKEPPTFKVGRHSFTYLDDFVLQAGTVAESTKLKESELVFVGYGINAPEYQWNDYKHVDVKGKVVLILVNDPGYATLDNALFTGKAMTYYGRWTYKFEEAARQGAAGAIVIHETKPAGYPWSVVRNSSGQRFSLVSDRPKQNELSAIGWVHESAGKRILKHSNLDLTKLKSLALSREFKAITLDQKINVGINSSIKYSTSYNVMAKLPGTSLKDEILIYSAHWDHLGKKGVEEDSIFNGAIDNATGVAGLLELARAFSKEGKPKRSILFFSPTAEEQGLLGSEYFTQNSPFPVNKMVATLNMDGLNVFEPEENMLLFGRGQSELEDYLAVAAKSQKRGVKPDPVPETGLYYRSDHFSFAKVGVPSLLFLNIGTGGNDYVKQHYHKPSDEFNPKWPLTGATKDLEALYSMGSRLSNENYFPEWKDGSEFKAIRERSLN